MSQHLHHAIFSFSNGSSTTADHQIRRDTEEDDVEDRSSAVYETAGMLSEMFNFPLTAATNPIQGLDSSEFTWVSNNNPSEGMEGQGLSLSLSSKVEEMRMGSDHIGSNVLYFNQGGGGGVSSSYGYHYYHPYNKDLGVTLNHNIEVGFGSSLGAVNVMRSSKYVKPAQQLLQEFCSVGTGHFNNNKFSRNNNPNMTTVGGGGGGSKYQVPPLSSADRIEHQRRKVKLLSMLDEVDRRYNHYCEQMQMVVKSFDLVMGSGSAVPYTALAQKAMSRHFRCLKEAVAAEVKRSCEALGEKEGSSSGVTKGETPRLKALEQRLRQQRAFNQMGMMDQEAWRPQRGLPGRSVNILRAWLFEHFLHPYPSDADKHLLSRQTGLSRNQVSNWFINARVRLWKPMVEDMYQQEAKEDEDDEPKMKQARDHRNQVLSVTPQTPTPNIYTATATVDESITGKRSEINAPDTDSSLVAINRQRFADNQALSATDAVAPPLSYPFPATHDTCRHGTSMVAGTTSGGLGSSSTPLRFGTTAAGDVSLTLGLRHAGNMPPPDNSSFSVRDLGGY